LKVESGVVLSVVCFAAFCDLKKFGTIANLVAPGFF
jgi:hypothetical protein